MERDFDFEELARDVQQECSAEIKLTEVKRILRRALDDELDNLSVEEKQGKGEGGENPEGAQQSYEQMVKKLALAVDMQKGTLQKEWEEHVIEEEDGFVVEDEDGTVHGYDEEGDPL